MAQYEVTLRDYWRILRRRKGIVVFTGFLLGFFSFVLATIWQPIPIYTAAAKVQLISGQQSIANLYLEAYGGGGGVHPGCGSESAASRYTIVRGKGCLGARGGAPLPASKNATPFKFFARV